MFTLFKKDFNLLRLGGLPLLMSILLLAFGSSIVLAQSVDTVGAQAKVVVRLQNKTVQDSVVMPTFKVVVTDSITTTSDSVAITFAAGKFQFANKVPTLALSNANLTAASARVNSTSDTLFIKISGPLAGTADTLTISGVYMKGIGAAGVYSDSLTRDSLKFAIGHSPVYTAGAHPGAGDFVLLPGPIYNNAITVQPTTPVTAGTPTITATLSFTDKFGNVPNDSVTTIAVTTVLNGTSTVGNGTLTGTSTITHTVTLGSPGVCTYAYTGLIYKKAEAIQLVFTSLSGAAGASKSTAVTVNPDVPANISLELHSGSSDTITVDQATQYDLTVTDAYFNPVVDGTSVLMAEVVSHGGSSDSVSTTNGKVSVTFTPSKFFVGSETISFKSHAVAAYPATASILRPIVINPGVLGGIIVDYAGTASGTAVTEDIAAGVTVYARGFLRDTYGNPINATSATDVTFTKSGFLGTGRVLGTAALTSSMTQPLYPNTTKTAVGVAVPYTVSTNYSGGRKDSVLATAGIYSNTITIQNRSQVPATVKFYQVAGDSSLIVSNYANTTTLTDSVWDQYSNPVTAPTTETIAPVKAAYAMYVSTLGKTSFLRSADTTVADTLYPSSGAASTTIGSYKVSGLDTLKTWSAADPTVAKAFPFYVTPGVFAKVALAPHSDTNAIAGRVDAFTIEKQDTYGNHIDFGLAGGTQRGNSPSANFVVPTLSSIHSDSALVTVDTVSSGHNRGGYATIGTVKTGTAGITSVNGTLNWTATFTPYTVTADTQKFYVSMGGFNDTVLVRSIPTGIVTHFTIDIAAADSVKNAGDSVKVVITAFDVVNNQVYTYALSGQTFSVNNTSVEAIASADTTYYFSYVNSNGKYVKSTGVLIADTAFATGTGKATLYLHKFVADDIANTVSLQAPGRIVATSANGSLFKPLTSVGQTTWSVTASHDTVNVGGLFSYTITPRDKYYNINTTVTNFAQVSSNQGVNFDGGTNPKIFIGPTTYNATQAVQTVAPSHLIIYVSDGSTTIYGQSTPIVARIGTSVENQSNAPTEYALSQNYPNPFNPTTNITFDIPQNSSVKIAIYDMLGREVATLVNATYTPGHYTVPFNASQLSSGMYIYRMTSQASSGDQKLFTSAKKLMLLK